MTSQDLKATTEAYLDAFDKRELAACVGYYAEDATIRLPLGVYKGRQAIEGFHQDRFDADLRILHIDEIKIDGETATVSVTGTSKVTKAWRLNAVALRATVTFAAGLIKEAKFRLLSASPFEKW